MKSIFKQALWIVGLASVFGLVVNAPLVIRYAKGEFQDHSFLAQKGKIFSADIDHILQFENEEGPVQFIDSRSPEDYAHGHIPGAQNLPLRHARKKELLQRLNLSPAHPIIVYCSGANCPDSTHLAEWMADQEHWTIWVFTGGWEQWTSYGFPVEKGNGQK